MLKTTPYFGKLNFNNNGECKLAQKYGCSFVDSISLNCKTKVQILGAAMVS